MAPMDMRKIMALPKMRRELSKLRLYKVSEATGLSYPTLKRIADGKEVNPTLRTLKLISDCIRKGKAR